MNPADSLRLAVPGFALLSLACGLCGNTDQVDLPSPDGKHVARSYLYSCGATAGYSTRVDLDTKGDIGGWAPVYSAEGSYELRLRWPTSGELRIECGGCPPRHSSAPAVDGITITVESVNRRSNAGPQL